MNQSISGNKGQSLVEVLVAVGVFILGVATTGFLVLDANVSSRQGIESTQAALLAKEGLEAVRSMRDGDFDNLTSGDHGIALSGNKWVFSGTSDIQDQFTRKVTITNIDVDTKKIDSLVTWQFSGGQQKSVAASDYLTDWNQTQGQAGQLGVNISGAILTNNNRRLRGIFIQNTGAGNITIDKMTLSWSNGQLIEQVRIEGTTVWQWNGAGTPDGRQNSGTELNISNYTLNQGAQADEIDRIDFDGSMTGAVFIIKFIMTDNSTKYVMIDMAGGGGPEWQSPRFAAAYDVPANTFGNDVFVVGNTAYLTSNGAGDDLHLIDAADHMNPSLLSSLELNAGANGVVVSGNYAYIASQSDTEELQIVNISDPANPVKTGSYNKSGTTNALSVAVSGATAYLTAQNTSGYEFYSINVSNPSNPTLRGGLNIGANVNDVVVSGNYAYIAASDTSREFQVINITNPASPTIAARLNLPGTTNGLSVFVSGSYAYVGKQNTSGQGEFYAIDISNPSSPNVVGQFEIGANVNDIYISGTKAFLATGSSTAEFQVLDISTPSAPSFIGSFDLAATANSVFVANNTAFVATSDIYQELVILEPY